MFKKNKIYGFLTAVSLVLCFSGIDSFAQRGNETASVSLVRNAKQNGYKTVRENKEIYFEAIEVRNPLDGLRLQGEKEVEYRCAPNEIPFIKRLMFTNGRSNRQKVECLVLITPRIIISE